MYEVTKRMEIAGSHSLDLPYESKCSAIHGHNWIVKVTCRSRELTNYGMVIDFTLIKELIHLKLDHKFLNGVLNFNPTAENIAKWICDKINNYFEDEAMTATCSRVEVQESEGNTAVYEEELC